jgi:hypothetical protein
MKTPNFRPVDFYPNAKYYDYHLNALAEDMEKEIVIETKLVEDEFFEANEIINRIKNMGR